MGVQSDGTVIFCERIMLIILGLGKYVITQDLNPSLRKALTVARIPGNIFLNEKASTPELT